MSHLRRSGTVLDPINTLVSTLAQPTIYCKIQSVYNVCICVWHCNHARQHRRVWDAPHSMRLPGPSSSKRVLRCGLHISTSVITTTSGISHQPARHLAHTVHGCRRRRQWLVKAHHSAWLSWHRELLPLLTLTLAPQTDNERERERERERHRHN